MSENIETTEAREELELRPYLDTISLESRMLALDNIYQYGVEPILREAKAMRCNDLDEDELYISAYHIQEHAKAVGRCICRLIDAMNEHKKE